METNNLYRNGVSSPPATLGQMLAGYQVTQLIYVAAKLGLADILADTPKSGAELASIVGADLSVLQRLLRALTCIGVFEQIEEGSFGLTAVGGYLRTDAPGSLRAVAIFSGEDWVQRAWGGLLHATQTGELAFDHALGMSFDQYVARNPSVSDGLDQRAAGNTAQVAEAIAASYDFSDVRRAVDVGGSYGTLTAAILRTNAHLTGIVYDRPSVDQGARQYLAGAGCGDRCTFVAGDFFETVPSGGDVYILKSVIHDWDDARSLAILRNVRQAMANTARLLLVERLMPADGSPSFELATYDVMMMVLSNGCERTEAGYRALLATAGFTFKRVVPTPTVFSIIEAELDDA
jgi:O-methyltransferase domain/Dimerisation domain